MNIFVGNLAFSTTDHDVRQLFEPYGVVDTINIITDRYTGQSRGLASWKCPTVPPPKPPFRGSRARHLGAYLKRQRSEAP